MIEIELSKITEADLQGLIINSVSESNSIEYKERLSLNTDTEKKEFLKDLSAFANSSGGDILFGVKAEKGIPKQLVGIEIDNRDFMTLRIEDILRYGIQPRIPYIKIQFVPIKNDMSVLIIRVPKSWLSPHRIIFNKNNEFYLRLSAGSYPMDVDQLRTAFLASETVNKKIENFRLERISKIMGNEIPVLMIDGPKAILHIIPLCSLSKKNNVDLSKVASDPFNKLRPIQYSPFDWRYNFDGFMVFSRDYTSSRSYVQLFRNGITEAVNGGFFRPREEGMTIYPTPLKEETDEAFSRYLKLLKDLDIDPPIVIFMTLIGVKGYSMGIGDQYIYYRGQENMVKIDRDVLFLPEVMIEEYRSDNETVLKPIYDAIWNACGFERALIYDNKINQWKPQG
jgi:hypothetical protein